MMEWAAALVALVGGAVALIALRRHRRRARALLEAAGADAPDRLGLCPVCAHEPLVAQRTAGEDVCAACGGVLLSPDRARDLVFAPRGLTPGALKAVGTGRGLASRCPACGAGMRPVLVEDDVIDVCLSCGAAWCDARELDRLLHRDAFGG